MDKMMLGVRAAKLVSPRAVWKLNSRKKSFARGFSWNGQDEAIKSGRESRVFKISEEVLEAVMKMSKPVVALESAIITHGMPYPRNIETALGLEKIIRDMGVVPATIGVVHGKLTVGLSDEEIEILGTAGQRKDGNSRDVATVKVSRRDLPYACSQKLHGGTTVSGTIIGAVRAGIPLFVTGGLGGVHRDGHLTFDISADLDELGRSQIAVVSSGVKSILDIGKTLEYLETKGVCVCVLKKEERRGGDPDWGNEAVEDVKSGVENKRETWGKRMNSSSKFPSFFTPESPYNSPYTLGSEAEVAKMVDWSREFGTGSGILIAVPIPNEHGASGIRIEKAIQEAIRMGKEKGICGKDITPFLLGIVNELTGGESLNANQHLIENNARTGAAIALELFKLRRDAEEESGESRRGWKISPSSRANDPVFKEGREEGKGGRPIVIGGSSMDFIMRVQEEEIVNDGRTLDTRVEGVPGGVGRNVAEALQKLGHNPLLISRVGSDMFAQNLLREAQETGMALEGMWESEIGTPTAVYAGILNKSGECLHGLGDMRIHGEISPEQVVAMEKDIKDAPILLMDGNIGLDTMEAVMRMCCRHKVPVWFEPTEIRKAKKILQVRSYWDCIRYLSPNLRELVSLVGRNAEEEEGGRMETRLRESLGRESEEFRICGHLGNVGEDGGNNPKRINDTIPPNPLSPLISRAFSMFTRLHMILLTGGSQGFYVIRRQGKEEAEGQGHEGESMEPVFQVRHYPPSQLCKERIVSVSGAGDCLNAGFISGILSRANIHECSLKGREAAKGALTTGRNVPHAFTM